MKRPLLLLVLFIGKCLSSNAQTNLTADDILNKSIEFCGGTKNISKIRSSSLTYDLTTGDGSNASVIVKRETSKKYMRSVLSGKHIPSCMYYNGLTLTAITGETKTTVNDLTTIEEIKLQTYNQPQYGYKELSYSLKRLDDKKFNYFDCYVVSATAQNGYKTINYFDKTNYRLIMIIYPKGNKSLLIDYSFIDSVLFDTEILNIEKNLEQTTLKLTKINNNININPLWFSITSSHTTSVPKNIKEGVFISSDSALVTRTTSVQTEQKGNFYGKLFLNWLNDYAYIMINSKSIKKQVSLKVGDDIIVKIVSWNQDGYVCHYYSHGVSGTQEYKINK